MISSSPALHHNLENSDAAGKKSSGDWEDSENSRWFTTMLISENMTMDETKPNALPDVFTPNSTRPRFQAITITVPLDIGTPTSYAGSACRRHPRMGGTRRKIERERRRGNASSSYPVIVWIMKGRIRPVHQRSALRATSRDSPVIWKVVSSKLVTSIVLRENSRATCLPSSAVHL